jgi:heat shock protein HtpX
MAGGHEPRGRTEGALGGWSGSPLAFGPLATWSPAASRGTMINQLKTVLLLGVLSALVVGIGGALAPGSLALWLVLALAMNVGAYYFSDRLVLRMNGARPLTRDEAPGLHAMTEELAARAGIPAPRLFIIEDPSPNAFATGRNPAHGVVAVTTGILRVLPARELRGVLAHEIAHIGNRDILVSTVAASLAAVVSYVAHAVQFAAFFGGGQHDEDRGSAAGSLAMALVAPIAATIVQLAISRSREYLADETGARLAGDPDALATALETLSRGVAQVPASVQPATASLFIVNPFSGMGGVMNLFSTHPPMKERVSRLRALARRVGPAA